MQEFTTPIFKGNQTLIFQMLHGLNLLPSLFSVFYPLPITPMFNSKQKILLDLESYKKMKKYQQ